MENLSGLIKIEISEQHLVACYSVLSYKDRLNALLKQPVETSHLFGLIKRKKYPQGYSTCPFVFTFSWDNSDYSKAYTNYEFETLFNAIEYCKGKEVYLALDSYNTLMQVCDWYKTEWEG